MARGKKSEVLGDLKTAREGAPKGKWKTLEGGGALTVSLKPSGKSKLPRVASVEGILSGWQKVRNREEPHKEPRNYPRIVVDGRSTLCFMGVDGTNKLEGASIGAYVRVTATRRTKDTGMPSEMMIYDVEQMEDGD